LASVEGKNSNREIQQQRLREKYRDRTRERKRQTDRQTERERERERRRARRCVVQTPDWQTRKPTSLTPALVLPDKSITNCRINVRCPKTGRSQSPSFVILFNFAINSTIYEGDPN